MPEASTQRAFSSPLRWETPSVWVDQVVVDLPALLNDHAHLERKAASNALELLNRWPWHVQVHGRDGQSAGADRWSRALTSIAGDEVRHLGQVLRLLAAHGGHFERSHMNPYAADLRRLVRMGQAGKELVDRLLISALIEARSMERFQLLAAHAADEELRRFYASLVASERGHYKAFLELAGLVPTSDGPLEGRWEELLQDEAEIIVRQAPGCRMHAGIES